MREDQTIKAELLGQVQRTHQLLLGARDGCVEKAERHYRHVLGVFSGLILNGEMSDLSKAAHYLNLRERSARRKASDETPSNWTLA